MNAKKKPKPDDPEQSKRFIETAKALEAEESGKQFEKALKAVTPKKKAPKPK